MPKHFFIQAAIMLLLSLITSAQEIYKPGYIIIAKDTMRGYLKEDVESNLINGINFSINISGSANRFYTSGDIKAFYFNNGNFFKLVKFTDSKYGTHQYFAKYLLKGYYNLFSFRKNDVLYFILTNRDSVFFLYDSKYLNNGTLDEEGNYKQRLLFLSVGCAGVSKTLENLQYNENSLIAFIKKLNGCHEPAENSIMLYVKDESKLNLYAYAAALPLGDISEYTAKVAVRFISPSINKNTALNVGIGYVSYSGNEKISSVKEKHTYTILGAGLTLQYNLLTGKVQPYIEGGVGFAYEKENDPLLPDIQSRYGISLIFAGGIEGYITSNVVIKADWRYELFAHYPVIGIAYFFK